MKKKIKINSDKENCKKINKMMNNISKVNNKKKSI